jgi:hypothetical protein
LAPLAASGTFTRAYHCRAGVSGESWQLTAILHRQSKRPVKWGIGRLIEETRHNANVERLQRLLVVLGQFQEIAAARLTASPFDRNRLLAGDTLL